MTKMFKFIASILLAFLAGAIGSLATMPNIPNWYATLEKPFLNPPNYVFGPVWSLLYLLMGISLYLVWTTETKKHKTKAYIAFAVQLILNTAWSLVFFGLHQPVLAVVILALLLAVIIINIILFARISKTAAYLLLPYLLWSCFATYLNVGIAVLN